MASAARLIESGLVPSLSKELANQINTGVGNRIRLVELGMVPLVASTVVSQIGGSGNAMRLIELGVAAALALEIVKQIRSGGGTPTLLVLPSITGALTNGSTLTATPAVWLNANRVSGQWQRDGVAIANATNLTYIYNTSTDDVRFIEYVETANGTKTARSNALVGGAGSTYTANFNAPDGTLLNGYDGWTTLDPGGDEWAMVGGKLQRVKNGFHSYIHDGGSQNQIIDYVADFPAGGGSDGTDRDIYANFKDYNNNIDLRFAFNRIGLIKRVAGTATTMMADDYSFRAYPGDAFRLRVIGGYARIFVNNVELSASASANGGLGFDCRDVPADNRFALLGDTPDNAVPYPFPVIRALSVKAIPQSNVTIISVTSNTDMMGTTMQVIPQLKGVTTNGVTAIQYAILDASGTVLRNWMDATVTAGQHFTLTLDALPTRVNGTDITVLARDPANKNVAFSSVFSVPALQTIFPMRVGQQDGAYGYANKGDYFRDYGKKLDVRYNGYNGVGQMAGGLGGYDADGYINSYISGFTSYRYILPFFFAKTGVYTLAYPAGMTFTIGANDASMISYGNEYAIDANTAGRKITVAKNTISANATCDFLLSGIPTGRTATTLGLRPKITFDGDATPNAAITDEAISTAAFLKAKIFRMMDAQIINSNLYRYKKDDFQNYYQMSLKNAISFVNTTNQDLWFNVYTLQDDDAVRQQFDMVAATLGANQKVYIEYSNETWNGTFLQAEETIILGFQAGFANSSTSAGATALSPFYRLIGNFSDQSNPIPTRAFSANDYVCGNKFGLGVVVWKALQPIAANDSNATLPNSSNAYWQVVNSADDGYRARKRYTSYRTAQLATIAKAAYTAIGRDTSTILPVYAWQAVDVFPKDAFEFDNNWQVFKRYATAPYWDALKYMTANEKALYATDLPACLNAFFSYVPAALTEAVGTARNRKNELAAYLATKQVSIDSIQYANYEFHSHSQIEADGAFTDSTKKAALSEAIRTDQRSGDATASYLQRMRAMVGGDMCWYGRTSLPNPWLSQVDENDRTSPIAVAVSQNA